MQFDKTQILDLLKSQGNHEQAAQAEAQLPDQVDTDQHQNLLGKLGISPTLMISQLAGGGGGGGGGVAAILGKLGL